MRGYLKTYGLSDEKVADVIAGVFAFLREALQIADQFDEYTETCDDLSLAEEPFPLWNNYYDIAWGGLNFGLNAGHLCDFYYNELDKVCAKHTSAVANYLAMKLIYSMDSKLKSSKFQHDYCKIKIHYSVPYILDKLYLLVSIDLLILIYQSFLKITFFVFRNILRTKPKRKSQILSWSCERVWSFSWKMPIGLTRILAKRLCSRKLRSWRE